jgi:hypothetical protein
MERRDENDYVSVRVRPERMMESISCCKKVSRDIFDFEKELWDETEDPRLILMTASFASDSFVFDSFFSKTFEDKEPLSQHQTTLRAL